MGISGYIILTFFSAIILLIIGFALKSKVLGLISLITFAISIGLFLLVWNALSYM